MNDTRLSMLRVLSELVKCIVNSSLYSEIQIYLTAFFAHEIVTKSGGYIFAVLETTLARRNSMHLLAVFNTVKNI